MLVGAYRDNEVSSSHPLMRMLGAIRNAGTRIQEIVLAPLDLDDVGRLVTDALHCQDDSGHPLAHLVHEKTGGNPFFVFQFLTALSEEGLLRRDPDAGAWVWDLARIRAHGYTDNVVDLMVEKLKRLSNTTQNALSQLACLGNVVEIATLSLVFGKLEGEIHTALWEAARTGLILRLEGSYTFLHDRIQEAAYALIPEGERAGTHLRIGRVLLASMTGDGLAEHLFDVANQFNRGAALLIDRDEKAHVATIDLGAGRKARASAAYMSARGYFSAGMALLDEGDWGSHYELTFSLWLERAECELLSGYFEMAEQLIVELLQRAASNVEYADASCLKIHLHVLKGELPQAVDSALTCLRLFGIDLSEHPKFEQAQAEFETVWQTLDGRSIESLIDLPIMTDPELQAAMQVLSVVTPATYFTNIHLFCLLVCRMTNFSVQHGMTGASAHAYAHLGCILGPVFHRYNEGYRFAKLACDLVEKHGFIAYQAKVYDAMSLATQWTQSITTAIDFMRASFRAAIETGDLTYACYAMFLVIPDLLVRNDPLDAVWRESEMALEFVRKAGFADIADVIQSQQRFIAMMQGRPATFSTFSNAEFDEAMFEAQLTADRMAMTACFYWVVKLKARFLSGDYAEALTAADKAKGLLSAIAAQIQLLDYYYYAALTVAALYEKGNVDEQTEWRDLLTAHREQLREWAENYPPTFADKHLLVLAEIARLEGRTFEAMQLYEQAIRSARANGFVQNEALAHEVAAWFYLARGFETFAHTYLRNARNCYDRWGALGKVKQLDERYPRLHEERLPASTTATIGTPVRQLDVETVVKASQALSSEIVLANLIEKLMRIVVEHAGAERGLLILLRGDEPQIEAEAMTGHGGTQVTMQQAGITPSDLAQSALQYVIRTRERIVLDDASITDLYAEDEYVRAKRARSLLCLPIVKQTKFIAALYLENNLTPRAFTSDRVALLEMLASQAAISLENANLYADLQRNEAFLAQGQSISHTGSFGWSVLSGDIYWSEETYKIFELDRSVNPTMDFVFQRVHPEDRDLLQQTIDRAIHEKTGFNVEYRLLRPDASVKYLHVLARGLETSSGDLEFVGTVTDVTERKLAEEALRRSEAYLAEAQRLAHTSSWAWRISGRDAAHLSEEWYRIYGFDPDKGMPAWSELMQRIHPEDRAKWQEAIDRAIDEESDYEVEFRLLFPDGTVKYLRTIGHPVFGPFGDLIEFIGSSTDVTERKRADEERERLRQMQTYLAHFNRVTAMGELTASLAHEVNQPIAATVINAKTCLRWLQRDEPDLSAACAAATRIVKDGNLAAEIISRIRSQFKKETVKWEVVDVNEVIREMIALLHSEAMRQNISVRTELAADLPKIMGDRVQLQQVTMNLIVNSIDAMKGVDGTRELTIKSKWTEHEPIQVLVSDTGIGLPSQQAEQIFNAFFTTKPHGTGMGLRISRSIIESHGGRLWAADNFPRGATFQFTLPVTAAAAAA
jgi:PAS domain S-box-containing protein